MDAHESVARESIRDLVARYNSCGDSGRIDEVMRLFTPEATMDIDGEHHDGREAIRAMFDAVLRATSGAAAGAPRARYIRHFTATHQIDLATDGEGTGRCYYQTLTERGLDHWGRYVDRYRLTSDGWRFAHRKVTVDGMVEGGWCDSMPKLQG